MSYGAKSPVGGPSDSGPNPKTRFQGLLNSSSRCPMIHGGRWHVGCDVLGHVRGLRKPEQGHKASKRLVGDWQHLEAPITPGHCPGMGSAKPARGLHRNFDVFRAMCVRVPRTVCMEHGRQGQRHSPEGPENQDTHSQEILIMRATFFVTALMAFAASIAVTSNSADAVVVNCTALLGLKNSRIDGR